MKAKIILNQPLTQERYGLHFEKGEALCDNEYIITKLQNKGVKVEIIKEEKTIAEMTVAELKALAQEKGIEIPANAKKNDIIELLNNPSNSNEDDNNNNENDAGDGQEPETAE